MSNRTNVSPVKKPNQIKNPNLVYPPRDVFLPSPLPEARRKTVSQHNLNRADGFIWLPNSSNDSSFLPKSKTELICAENILPAIIQNDACSKMTNVDISKQIRKTDYDSSTNKLFKAQKCHRLMTPQLRKNQLVMENFPSNKTHPISASIRSQYMAAVAVRNETNACKALESLVQYDKEITSKPVRPIMTVAEKKWQEFVEWENSQGSMLELDFIHSVEAFCEASDQCMNDFVVKQNRIGQKIKNLCQKIATESTRWSRTLLDSQMCDLRDLVNSDSLLRSEIERALSWLQEDSAGYMADTVEAYRAKNLSTPTIDNAKGEEHINLITTSARSLQIISHRELVRGSSLLLQARKMQLPKLLQFDINVTHIYQSTVRPLLEWVRNHWPIERASFLVHRFHQYHSSREWTKNVSKSILDIIDSTIRDCRLDPPPQASSSHDSDTNCFPKSDNLSLPLNFDSRTYESVSNKIHESVASSYKSVLNDTINECHATVTGLLECSTPWPGCLVNSNLVYHIADILCINQCCHKLEPVQIGRALASHVRRLDWQYYFASVFRSVIASLNQFRDQFDVCQRLCRCMVEFWQHQLNATARILYNVKNTFSHCQIAHRKNVSKLNTEITELINSMILTNNELQCSEEFHMIENAMDNLQQVCLGHTSYVKSLLKSAVDDVELKVAIYEQKWNEPISTPSVNVEDSDPVIDITLLRNKIDKFERCKRTQVGFVNLNKGDHSAGTTSSATSNLLESSKVQNDKHIDQKGVNKVKIVQHKKGALVTGIGIPISIDFQHSKNKVPEKETVIEATSKIPFMQSVIDPDSYNVETYTLTSPLDLPDDVEPMKFELGDELNQLCSNIEKAFLHPYVALSCCLSDTHAMYQVAFGEWKEHVIREIREFESASLFETSNDMQTFLYDLGNQTLNVQKIFTQHLIGIQTSNHQASVKIRQNTFFQQWESVIDQAEHIFQNYIDQLLEHEIHVGYTLQAVGKQSRLVTKINQDADTDAGQIVLRMVKQWKQISNTETGAGGPTNNQIDILDFEAVANQFISVDTGENNQKIQVGINRLRKIRNQLHSISHRITANLECISEEIQQCNQIHTALTEIKLRVRARIAADEAKHAKITSEIQHGLQAIHGTTTMCDSKSTETNSIIGSDQIEKNSIYLDQFSDHVHIALDLWNALNQRAKDLGFPVETSTVSTNSKQPVTPSWITFSRELNKATPSIKSARSRGTDVPVTQKNKCRESSKPNSKPQESYSEDTIQHLMKKVQSDLDLLISTYVLKWPNRYSSQKTWVMMDALSITQLAWIVECESIEMVNRHCDSCMNDINQMTNEYLPKILCTMIDRVMVESGSRIDFYWNKWTKECNERVSQLVTKNTARQKDWDLIILNWRTDDCISNDQIMSKAKEWLMCVQSENQRWADDMNGHMEKDIIESAASLLPTLCQLVGYLILASFPLIQIQFGSMTSTGTTAEKWAKTLLDSMGNGANDIKQSILTYIPSDVYVNLESHPILSFASKIRRLNEKIEDERNSRLDSIRTEIVRVNKLQGAWFKSWVDKLNVTITMKT